MAERTSPAYSRRRLGRRLREMRERAGLTLEEAAPRLEKTRSSLCRIENGQTRADVHLLKSMMDLYDVRDDELLDLSRAAAKKAWWQPYGLADLGYVDAETEACGVREFSLGIVPGLLQTEDYTRALMLGMNGRRTEEQLRNQITVRQIRQERLTDDHYPLELVAVVDEAALYRPVGGPEVMRAQLARLAEVAALDRVSLQVLPFAVGVHAAMVGPFIVLEFPDPGDPDLLYVEYPTGALQAENDGQVREARLRHEQLCARALPPEESAGLVERLARDRYQSP